MEVAYSLGIFHPSSCIRNKGLVAQSCLTLCTPWTVVHQDPLSMEFSREEYWSQFPFSPPGDLPDPGMESESLVSPALAGSFFTNSPT